MKCQDPTINNHSAAMGEQWRPTGEKLPTGEVPLGSMSVSAEVKAEREADFAARRAQLLGSDERIREAARRGDDALIRSWPAGDMAINKPGQGGWTALHFAAREGRVEVVGALLGKGADPRLRTTKGERALHCAAANGHVAAVTLLLGCEGADVNAPGPYKATALHVASTPAVAEALLQAGADRSIKYRGRTPAVHHKEKGNNPTAAAIARFVGEPQHASEPAATEDAAEEEAAAAAARQTVAAALAEAQAKEAAADAEAAQAVASAAEAARARVSSAAASEGKEKEASVANQKLSPPPGNLAPLRAPPPGGLAPLKSTLALPAPSASAAVGVPRSDSPSPTSASRPDMMVDMTTELDQAEAPAAQAAASSGSGGVDKDSCRLQRGEGASSTLTFTPDPALLAAAQERGRIARQTAQEEAERREAEEEATAAAAAARRRSGGGVADALNGGALRVDVAERLRPPTNARAREGAAALPAITCHSRGHFDWSLYCDGAVLFATGRTEETAPGVQRPMKWKSWSRPQRRRCRRTRIWRAPPPTRRGARSRHRPMSGWTRAGVAAAVSAARSLVLFSLAAFCLGVTCIPTVLVQKLRQKPPC
jgi:hypothetical protein